MIGLGDTALAQRIWSEQQALHVVAQQIYAAHQAGDTAAEADARQRFALLANDLRALAQQQYQGEAPGRVLSTLNTFSDAATSFLNDVGPSTLKDVQTALAGIAKLPGALGNALPLLAVAAIAIGALVYLPKPRRRTT